MSMQLAFMTRKVSGHLLSQGKTVELRIKCIDFLRVLCLSRKATASVFMEVWMKSGYWTNSVYLGGTRLYFQTQHYLLLLLLLLLLMFLSCSKIVLEQKTLSRSKGIVMCPSKEATGLPKVNRSLQVS